MEILGTFRVLGKKPPGRDSPKAPKSGIRGFTGCAQTCPWALMPPPFLGPRVFGDTSHLRAPHSLTHSRAYPTHASPSASNHEHPSRLPLGRSQTLTAFSGVSASEPGALPPRRPPIPHLSLSCP